jgi:hypothetical protein
MIMVTYVDLWLVYSRVASLLDGAKLELIELKARSSLLGACTSYPLLRSDLVVSTIEIKDLKHKHDHSSRYTILFPSCDACGSLMGKQEVAYLTSCIERIVVSEKLIKDDLSLVEESATKSTYKLGVGFER